MYLIGRQCTPHLHAGAARSTNALTKYGRCLGMPQLMRRRDALRGASDRADNSIVALICPAVDGPADTDANGGEG